MEQSNNTMKKICIGLGVLVAALLLAIAFLLGRQSSAKNTGGAGRTDGAGASVSEQAALPSGEATEDGEAATDAPAQQGETAPQAPQGEADTQSPPVPAINTPEVPAQTTDAPKTLEIDMSSGSLTFEVGAAFDIRYDPSVIRVDRNGNSAVIENDHSNPTASERKRMDVVVTVPENYAFDDVEIEMGAGKLITRALRTGTLELEMGAGSASLEGLVATASAEIRNGAGAFTIKSGSLNNLTMQCGAGATQVKAALTGSSRVVAAVGAVDIQLDGKESDYTVAFQMGLGACYYNNSKIARSGAYGDGPNRVDITGGFGVMRVNVG